MDLLVNVDVDDLEKGIAFYGRAFGLRVGRRLGSRVVEMLGGSSAIYLLAKAPGSTASAAAPVPRDYGRHWTPVHLDFVVADVEAAVRDAQRAGARLEGEVQSHDWGRIATMSDPFGHGFCVLEFIGRGYGEITGGGG